MNDQPLDKAVYTVQLVDIFSSFTFDIYKIIFTQTVFKLLNLSAH